MFSKNSSSYLPSAASLCDEILFDHDMLSAAHYLAGDAPLVDAFFNHQDVAALNASPSGQPSSCPRAAAVKKDRHSKINTAQGPRDRRVRLSIGVARRFFDLQEILGFDKPSKTLDWLLTKSKTAIKDLVQSTKENASSSSPSEVDSPDGKRKPGESSKQKDLAKESRAKARARARERTREKMSIKKLNLQGDSSNPSVPIQNMNNQLEYCKIREAMLHCHPSYDPTNEDLIEEESIVIKRKVKQYPSSILGFQQNLIISSSNYGVPSPTNNWDITSSFASQSNICAILDQHRFIN